MMAGGITAGWRVGGLAGGWVVAGAVLLTAGPPARLAAQDTTAIADTASRVGPLGALWRSMLVPGWGQAVSDRHTVGAIFVAWEGVAMMMTLKAGEEADYFREIDSPLLDHKRQEVEDWVVIWVFNHLFAGMEAFVAAHLRDFPPDLKLRAVPGGIGVSLPLPRF